MCRRVRNLGTSAVVGAAIAGGSTQAMAAWTEPAIAAVMMSSPLAPPPVSGTTYYVDKAGLGGTCNDANPGTPSQPWCTMGKAMQALRAGDQALIRAATYREGNLRPASSGDAGDYIAFKAYPGEHPVLDCNAYFCIDEYSPGARSYLVFDGLDMYGANQIVSCNGSAGCHHIWMINGKYHDYASSMFFTSGTMNIVLSNNEIYNAGGQAVTVMDSGNIVLEFNTVHDNGRDADDDGAMKCMAWNCIMRYNSVYNNHRDPASTSTCFNPKVCQGVTGLYFDNEQDKYHPGSTSYIYNNEVHDNDIGIQVFWSPARVFNNVVYHNGFGPGTYNTNFGHGITVVSGDTAQVDFVSLHNNSVFGNRNDGIHLDNSVGNIQLRNNIAMNNGGPEVVWGSFTAYTGDYDADNDLIFDSAGSGPLIWVRFTSYDSLDSFRARPGNTMWRSGLQADPRFTAPAQGNFHLQSTSPARNAGTPVSLFDYDQNNISRPQEGGWDVGALEYLAGAPPDAAAAGDASPGRDARADAGKDAARERGDTAGTGADGREAGGGADAGGGPSGGCHCALHRGGPAGQGWALLLLCAGGLRDTRHRARRSERSLIRRERARRA